MDAELYLPKSWGADRDRCRAAGIPDELRYRLKWKLALDQLVRLDRNGVRFNWLTFDEGYGSKVPFLWVLGRLGQKFVAEVPKYQPGTRVTGGPASRSSATSGA